MKKIGMYIFLIGAILSACTSQKKEDHSDHAVIQDSAASKYTCPMHPEVTSDKPGKCSKCSMALTEKKEDHSGHQH